MFLWFSYGFPMAFLWFSSLPESKPFQFTRNLQPGLQISIRSWSTIKTLKRNKPITLRYQNILSLSIIHQGQKAFLLTFLHPIYTIILSKIVIYYSYTCTTMTTMIVVVVVLVVVILITASFAIVPVCMPPYPTLSSRSIVRQYLVGGVPTPLKNMSSPIGMMTFLIYGKIKFMFQSPPTRYMIYFPYIINHQSSINHHISHRFPIDFP